MQRTASPGPLGVSNGMDGDSWMIIVPLNGWPGLARTSDNRINSAGLYQLSYGPSICF